MSAITFSNVNMTAAQHFCAAFSCCFVALSSIIIILGVGMLPASILLSLVLIILALLAPISINIPGSWRTA